MREEDGKSKSETENLAELVCLLEVLDDAFVLIRLYHGHPQQIYSQMTAVVEVLFRTGQQEK